MNPSLPKPVIAVGQPDGEYRFSAPQRVEAGETAQARRDRRTAATAEITSYPERPEMYVSLWDVPPLPLT